MSSYGYEAVDSDGLKTRGTLDVADQNEALRRIKEMGLFPTKVVAATRRRFRPAVAQRAARHRSIPITFPFFGERLKLSVLSVFTRQLATLLEAGMPLMRGLRTLAEQAENKTLKRVIEELAASIDSGSSLSEALLTRPRIFNHLYVNMVKAGELGGALELTLRRLAEFMEKAHKIKGKVKAAMVYPTAVLMVAGIILAGMMVFVIPRFQGVFEGLLAGRPMPPFTRFVMHLSDAVRHHAPLMAGGMFAVGVVFMMGTRTQSGRRYFDRFKLSAPVFGSIFRKAAISRFARTFGTLLGSGVPVLQALEIVRETAGNVVVGKLISNVHESVKQGDTIALQLKSSRVFPAMVAGMVDIGEQTGALPDMLLKIADTYDDEVDNSVTAMTSLLEPLMIIFLAVVVGGIVIAMFLPILDVVGSFDHPGDS